MKEQKRTFADLCAEFIGKPYSPLGKGPDAYGCLGFCYAFLAAAGKRIDDAEWTHKGYGPDNFFEAWKQDRAGLEAILLEGADRIGAAVPVSRKLAGDFLILKSRHGNYFPGIYVGNGNCMASYSDIGVRVFRVDGDGITVVKARRL